MGGVRTALSAALATVATVATVALGVSQVNPVSAPPARQGVPDTPLGQLDLTALDTPRTPFCDRIPVAATEAAVGGPATPSAYVSGENTELEPGFTDISDELGCVFTAGDVRARVWVFAAAIDVYDAQQLVDEARADEKCAPAGELSFGRPGIVLDCTRKKVRRIEAVGRIGDAWVHCELSAPKDQAGTDFLDRGQRWCVEAAFAMPE